MSKFSKKRQIGEITTTLTIFSLIIMAIGLIVGNKAVKTTQQLRGQAQTGVCPYSAINEIRDNDTGQVLTGVSGFSWRNSFNESGRFPGSGQSPNLANVFTTGDLGDPKYHDRFMGAIRSGGYAEASVTLIYPPDYEIASGFVENYHCDGDMANTCTPLPSFSSNKATIERIRITCDGSITYGWKVQKNDTVRPGTIVPPRFTTPSPTPFPEERREDEPTPTPTPTVYRRPTREPSSTPTPRPSFRIITLTPRPTNIVPTAPLPTATPIPISTPIPCTINSKVTVVDEQEIPLSTNKFINKDQWGFSNGRQYERNNQTPSSKFTGNTAVADYRNIPMSFKEQNPSSSYSQGEKTSMHLFTDNSYQILGWKIKTCGFHIADFQCDYENNTQSQYTNLSTIDGVPLNCLMNYDFEWRVQRKLGKIKGSIQLAGGKQLISKKVPITTKLPATLTNKSTGEQISISLTNNPTEAILNVPVGSYTVSYPDQTKRKVGVKNRTGDKTHLYILDETVRTSHEVNVSETGTGEIVLSYNLNVSALTYACVMVEDKEQEISSTGETANICLANCRGRDEDKISGLDLKTREGKPKDIACCPYEDKSPLIKPSEFRCTDTYDGSKPYGCFCTNAGQCREGGGTIAIAQGKNYCAAARDVICCLGGAKPEPPMTVPNDCCGQNEPGETTCQERHAGDGNIWSCTGANSNCTSGKKCIKITPSPTSIQPTTGNPKPTGVNLKEKTLLIEFSNPQSLGWNYFELSLYYEKGAIIPIDSDPKTAGFQPERLLTNPGQWIKSIVDRSYPSDEKTRLLRFSYRLNDITYEKQSPGFRIHYLASDETEFLTLGGVISDQLHEIGYKIVKTKLSPNHYVFTIVDTISQCHLNSNVCMASEAFCREAGGKPLGQMGCQNTCCADIPEVNFNEIIKTDVKVNRPDIAVVKVLFKHEAGKDDGEDGFNYEVKQGVSYTHSFINLDGSGRKQYEFEVQGIDKNGQLVKPITTRCIATNPYIPIQCAYGDILKLSAPGFIQWTFGYPDKAGKITVDVSADLSEGPVYNIGARLYRYPENGSQTELLYDEKTAGLDQNLGFARFIFDIPNQTDLFRIIPMGSSQSDEITGEPKWDLPDELLECTGTTDRNTCVVSGDNQYARYRIYNPVSRCEVLKQGGDMRLLFVPNGYQNREQFLKDASKAADDFYKNNLPDSIKRKFTFKAYLNFDEPISPIITDDEINPILSRCQSSYAVVLDNVGSWHAHCGNWIARLGGNSIRFDNTVLSHELGHCIANLWDEYLFYNDDGSPIRSNGRDPFGKRNPNSNCLATPDCAEWKNKPYRNQVNCIAGCNNIDWYRSTEKSIMNDVLIQNFNPPSLASWEYYLRDFSGGKEIQPRLLAVSSEEEKLAYYNTFHIQLNHSADKTLTVKDVSVKENTYPLNYKLRFDDSAYKVTLISTNGKELFSGYINWAHPQKPDSIASSFDLYLPYYKEATTVDIKEMSGKSKLKINLADYKLPVPQAKPNLCGNGICDGPIGENENSCRADCKAKETSKLSSPTSAVTKKLKSSDLNGDGAVNALDYAMLIQHYGEEGNNLVFDLNSDKSVNAIDLSVLLEKLD